VASTNEELDNAFVLRAEVLSQIWALLAEKVGPVLADIYCSDRITRDYVTSEALLKYENPPGRSIQRLDLYARRADKSFYARISLRGERKPLVRIEADGEEQGVTNLRDTLLDIFAGTKPWYSSVSHSDGISSAIAFFTVFGTSVMLLFLLFGRTVEGQSTTVLVGSLPLLVASIVAIVVVSLGSAYAMPKLVNRWFPRAVFAIGQGKARYERLERFQWVVLIGFLVSLAASASLLIFGFQATAPSKIPADKAAAVPSAK
jgi:hypothetical protein